MQLTPGVLFTVNHGVEVYDRLPTDAARVCWAWYRSDGPFLVIANDLPSELAMIVSPMGNMGYMHLHALYNAGYIEVIS